MNLSSRHAVLVRQAGWLLCALFGAAYCAVLVHPASGPFQDNPNHLARAVVMADLIFHKGGEFGSWFQYQFLAVPYIAGDLMLATAVEVFGPRGGDALWTGLVFLSLPAALWFYLRTLKVGRDGQLLGLLLSLYLSTDWFFFMGFFEYRIGIAATVATLGIVQLLRAHWSARLLLFYALLVVLGYLIHLASLVCLAAGVGITALVRLRWRTTTLRREIALMLPFIAVFAWHFGVARYYSTLSTVPLEEIEWDGLLGKIKRLPWDLLRFRSRTDWPLVILFLVCLWWPTHRHLRRGVFKSRDVIETLALLAVFLAFYAVLPMANADAYFVDVRPLAFIPVMLLVGWAQLQDESLASPVAGFPVTLALALALVGANLAYVQKYMARYEGYFTEYRRIVAAIPRGARVMLVNTHGESGMPIEPMRHAGEFVLVDRGAFTSDLFSADGGQPMKYFRYVKKPYVPDQEEQWYREWPTVPVDWNKMACAYDFFLVTKPYLADRIRLSTQTVAENGAAALLAIPKQECRRRAA